MSDISSSDVKKPMEEPEHDLSKAMGQLTVTTDGANKTSPSLSDMPIDVVGLIIDRSEYKEQLKLRKVSKSLRAFVDKRKPACELIEVIFWNESAMIIFGDHSVLYANHKIYRALARIQIVRDDFKEAVIDDLASTLKNPKLQLKKFNVLFNGCDEEDIGTYYNNLQCILKRLNHQLSVKKVELCKLNFPTILSILPCLKPGFLENISIWLYDETRESNWRVDSTEMDKVALLDQWKQAEELELQFCFVRFPLEYAKNFKRFRIKEDKIDGDNFIRIKDFFSKMDNFEQCILSSLMFSFFSDSVYELLGAPVSSSTTEEIFHHYIPDSDFYLEFTKPIKDFPPKMSEISSSDGKKPMQKPSNDLTGAMGQLSVNSDKTSSTKNLSDMPVDVVRLIIERCEYIKQLKLRKVSKSHRALVDKQKPACKSIKVQCYLYESTIHFDNYHVVYTEELDEPDDYDPTGIYVERDDFEEAALDDLASTLKNPKLELEELSVYFVDGYKESRDLDGYYDKLQCIFKSLNRQLSVEHIVFKLPTLSRLLSILPCFQPGVLMQISLDLLFKTNVALSIDSTGMDKVALLEQWKQAEELELWDSFDMFPMEYATHFKRFIIVEYIFDADKIARITDYLSKLQNFEQCTLSSLSFHANVHQVLGEPVSSNAMEEVFHHLITDSDYYLECIKPIRGCDVEIVKKKRESS